MKIGMIHLSDLHLNADHNWLNGKIDKIGNALKNDFTHVENVFIIVSGDIANKGKTEEYIQAKNLLEELMNCMKVCYPKITFDFILVPGNHDCNFDLNNQTRINNIEKVDYNTIGNIDTSVIDLCINVQRDFWRFYSEYHPVPKNKLFFQQLYQLENISICFNCYNTSWMSQKDEKVGTLFFPVNLIEPEMKVENNQINLGLFHHPFDWFNPNTEKNNKVEFKKHLEKNNALLFYGHEHEEDYSKNQELKTLKETIFIEGESLQHFQKLEQSGFQSIVFDITRRSGLVRHYSWESSLYSLIEEKPFNIDLSSLFQRKFRNQDPFIKKINTVTLPLKFDNRDSIQLSEIFIFPDLENIKFNDKKLDNYIDSSQIVSQEKKLIVIEGEDQSGKSSLLYMYYLKLMELGLYPLYVDSTDIRKLEPEKVIKKIFEKQYVNGQIEFEAFRQSDNQNKVLLIDNLHHLNFNNQAIVEFLKELNTYFSKIIITSRKMFGCLPRIQAEFEDLGYFVIKPLGYKKRNDLIERYHKLGDIDQKENDDLILQKTKESFHQLQVILGEKLIPSFPVFVITILQTLHYAKPIDLRQTSYGYCYQSLLHIALSEKAKVINDDIDSYFNFLSEFAYSLYNSSREYFYENQLYEFYSTYKTQYLVPSYEELKDKIFKSGILRKEDDSYLFSYNYIYYFLVARKIAEIVTTEKGKELVTNLCNNLHNETNANILIFIAHHTKDVYLIDEAILSSMLPFENISPLTLERTGFYSELIQDIIKVISSDIIDSNRTPEAEREKMLIKKDEIARKSESNPKSDEENIHEELFPIYQAFRAIEIVGQIVKNRKGSLDRTKIIEMIKELYLTGFRTISFFGMTFKNAKDEFADNLKNRIESDDTRAEIEAKISNFFQYISLQACLAIFSKLVHSVGNKDLKDLFDEVAEEINTPAAKLVTFSIKTYFDKMSIRELETLAREFERNPVAFQILKYRVKSYMYQNHLDYKSKQKIADILHMKLTSIQRQIR